MLNGGPDIAKIATEGGNSVIYLRNPFCRHHVRAADQPAGIGRTGITSTDSPGKMVKCGWFSNSLAAASCEVRANHREAAHRVADVLDPARRDLLGLAERSAHGDDRGLVLLDPRLPGRDSLAFLDAPFRFGRAFQAIIFGLVLLPRKTAR